MATLKDLEGRVFKYFLEVLNSKRDVLQNSMAAKILSDGLMLLKWSTNRDAILNSCCGYRRLFAGIDKYSRCVGTPLSTMHILVLRWSIGLVVDWIGRLQW